MFQHEKSLRLARYVDPMIGRQHDAALGQPSVTQVSVAGPGSRSELSPKVYAGIGGVAGLIVFSQLFVLLDNRRRIVRTDDDGGRGSW